MSNFDPFLNTAETLAHFQSTGTFPDDRERLNKWAKLPLMAGAAVFKSLAGMLSRPVALIGCFEATELLKICIAIGLVFS